MKRVSSLIDYSIFFLLALLTFLMLLESFVAIPSPLQVLGRMHPLVLHLPIGFVVILALLPAVKQEVKPDSYHQIQLFLLQLFALALAFSAVTGFFLAQEPGYQSELINWHKWTATGSSYLGYSLLILKRHFPERPRLFNLGLYTSLLAILITGHLGGSITHGRDYLLEPIRSDKAKKISPESTVFAAAIQPIFKAKCAKCHNSSKQKGGLSMASAKSLLAGGENGPIWIAGQAENSTILQRIHLPVSAEEHMPPEDQPQLNKHEIELIYHWINSGADFELNLGALDQKDSLFLALTPLLHNSSANVGAERYTFKPASAEIIQTLNTPYRSISPIAQGSPALSVDFFMQQAFQLSFLEELSPLRKQIIAINLSKMPIDDEGLKTLSQFPNLEKVILNGTNITGATLGQLSSCQKLKEIALSNTKVQKSALSALTELPLLRTVYAWETQIKPEDLVEITAYLPDLTLELGYQVQPEEMLQLRPPQLLNDHTVLSSEEKVLLKTKFPGAVIRYTTDGSEPDSLSSTVFSTPFPITAITTIKARTCSEGWLASESVIFTLFPEGKKPDTTILLSKTNPAYTGEGAKTLTDKQKGEINNFKTPAWLGYQENPLSVLFNFGETPPLISKIVGSFGQNLGPEIFLPEQIKVYGGAQPDQMQLLRSIRTRLPDGYEANQVVSIAIEFEASRYSFYKLEAYPYPRLPKWHQSSGSDRMTWVFIDEVFFY